jgi:hypothetical protein
MNWPIQYNRVFSALKGVEGPTSDGHYASYCPAHDDRKGKSLSLQVGTTGALILRCHASDGCTTQKIVAAIGLGMVDLFPDADAARDRMVGKGGRDRKFVCAYDYKDEAGGLLYQTVRWQKEDGSKTFTQRRPNPVFDKSKPPGSDNPRYLSGVEGVRRVLYRLPEMIVALQRNQERWVVVIEGEKAVDYCRSLGMVATTNAMGAGKWHTDYALALRGQKVLVVPDADLPDEKSGRCTGWEHAVAVCRSLYGLAREVRLLPLPGCRPKWGLDDWLTSRTGSPKDKLAALAELLQGVPPWTPRLADLPFGSAAVGAEMLRQGQPTSAAAALGRVEALALRFRAALAEDVLRGPGTSPDLRETAMSLAAAVLASVGEFTMSGPDYPEPPEYIHPEEASDGEPQEDQVAGDTPELSAVA